MNPLHAATDELNQAITKAETTFKNLGLGVCLRVPMSETEALTFQKESKVWRLMFESETDCVPLVNASREARLRAVPFLLTFKERLQETCAMETDRVQVATETLLTFLETLTLPTPE